MKNRKARQGWLGSWLRRLPVVALIVGLSVTRVAAFSWDNPPGPQFSPTQIEQQRQAGATIHDLIVTACQSGKPSVTIPPGDYRFVRGEGSGPFLKFEGLRRTADNPFTIEAKGVTFWFDLPDDEIPNCQFALEFSHCSHLAIDGLTIDRGNRGCMEGKITQLDYTNNRIEIQASAGTFIPTSFRLGGDQRLIPFKANGDFCTAFYALQEHGQHLRYRDVEPGTQPGRYWVDLVDRELLQHNGDPQWIGAFGPGGTLSEGDGLCLLYTNTTALTLLECDAIILRSFTDYIAKGFIAEEGGAGGHLWQDCYFGPRPATNQWQGGDGFMVAAMGHGSTYDHITIVSSTDDPVNIHGRWGAIDQVADHQVTFSAVQADGNAAVGDRVLFYDKISGELKGQANVTAITDKTYTLDQPTEGFAGCVAEWPTHENAGWVFQNCTFRDCYQRILAVTGPGKIIDCSFTRLGQGIVLGANFATASAKDGFEGGLPHDITISGNTFTDVDMRPGSSVVSWLFKMPGRQGPPVATGLSISGNTFNLFNSVLRASNFGGIAFSKNVMNYPSQKNNVLQQLLPPRSRQALCLDTCSGVQVDSNLLNDAEGFTLTDLQTHSRLLSLKGSCADIEVDGKTVGP